ncbi:MAG: metallophosphoesterase [Bacteroidetes bacterium]|nr:metallophosphoesterase [Bacteroidota bacterium]MDA0937890.1 metallophosphoesterase [Bacteroidota bacterium]MDA1344080.1 metallophosphoesterase [Bacteroidota bacterium]
MLRWTLFILFFALFEWYAFQAIKTVTQNRWIWLFYSIIVISIFGSLIWGGYNRSEGMTVSFNYAIGSFLMLIAFQILLIAFLFIEDLARIFQAIYGYLTGNKVSDAGFLPSRRKFVSQIALGLASIPLTSLLYGMYKGRYNYKVLQYELTYDDLPEAFDGFTVTQISDVHSGSFDNAKKVQYGIDLINRQQSDVILFTGDFVNNRTSELDPWIDTFAQLKAPFGKYSVMGNHDYGDYMQWPSEAAKVENFEAFKKAHQSMGFDLLLNESRFLEKDGQRLALIGVENWGAGRFKKAGDLNKAVSGLQATDFKVLMTHDPSHWEAEVLPHPFPFHLTLSGHTHGMQFGIEIPGWIKWSPAQWRYKQWAGIYERDQQRINVNRGFGFLAYPGRVGMWPEVSVITLRRTQSLT